MPTEIVCPFCDAEEFTLETAMAEGWTPCYWEDETTCIDRPVCPACAFRKLDDLDSDPILKPEFRAQSESPGEFPGPIS